jgi:hypothetical protein
MIAATAAFPQHVPLPKAITPNVDASSVRRAQLDVPIPAPARIGKGTPFRVRFPKPVAGWKMNSENNLADKGFTRSVARKLVEWAASYVHPGMTA